MANVVTSSKPCWDRSIRRHLDPGVYCDMNGTGKKDDDELFVQDATKLKVASRGTTPDHETIEISGQLIDGREVSFNFKPGEYRKITLHGANVFPRHRLDESGNVLYIKDEDKHRPYDSMNLFNLDLSKTSGIQKVSINGGYFPDIIRVDSMPPSSLLHVQGDCSNDIPDTVYLNHNFKSKLQLTAGRKGTLGTSTLSLPVVMKRSLFDKRQQVQYNTSTSTDGSEGYLPGSSFLLKFTD